MIDTRREKILNLYDDTNEIAKTLLQLADGNYSATGDDLKDIEEFIYYHLRTPAQNEYNDSGYRLFYNLLQNIVYNSFIPF